MKINLAGVQISSGYKAQEQELVELKAKIDAIDKAQAVIEFNLDGTIITANQNFLSAMGYTYDEVVGKHHSMFVEPEYRASNEYMQFWDKLNRGEFSSGEYKRIAKGGRPVWIQATYNPILDSNGRPYKVIKFASDITQSKLQAADHQGQIDAISKSQAVIEFNMDGTICHANDNFLGAMGYTLNEVRGHHHKMFVDSAMADSPEYQAFWQKLNRGEYEAGEFKRVGKGGKEIWIQASYNPILDINGKPVKVVKYAVDITAQKQQEAQSRKLADLSSALKLCNANVMLADNDLNICYMNNGMEQMLRDNQSQIKEELPNFNVDTLLGSCADIFHQNVQHQRSIVSTLDTTKVSKIKVGKLTFRLTLSPWTNQNGERLGTVIEWYDLTAEIAAQAKERALSEANARVKAALDKCQANVMLADNDLNIIYMNDSVSAMLSGNEAKLRTVLPNFNAQKLIGTCVDDFHSNPAHQRALLQSLTSSYNAKLKIADLTFQLVATPIFDDDGSRIGTVVEWNDVTQALAASEKERAQAAANARIKIALDKCQANVMMADVDLNIIYMNESVESMLRGNERQLRKALPNFAVDKLIGTCVDDFHKNPAHQRSILEDLQQPYSARLNVADLLFDLVATPVFDTEGTRLGSIVEWNDVTEIVAKQEKELQIANENARIKQALDCVSTNTMIADADNNIIYMNDAVNIMMANAEKDIKAVLPNFDAKNLIGQNMDSFHRNPAHQKDLLKHLTDAYTAEINVGVRTFALTANPILSDDKERIGSVVEWTDRTEEVAIEREIADLIGAAGSGDLTNRIEESGKSGFFLNLAGGLNQLVGIAEGVINETAAMLDAMAHGNLTKRIESDYQGAFDKLKSDANGTAEKLTEVITRISNASSAVASGAEEIAQGNTDLSQRTEEQASSLEETASSMEQMTSTVKQNAENAKVANDLAADATSKAQKGGDVVKRAVNSMSEINESSKKIADIIGVIDEIAFQTNLLALNAAVEAARAGEQGRGFAVVAGEVRNLAQRSAAAAKEIKDLIRDSVSKVQDGSQLVNESGATLNEIVEAISRVTAMIGDISNASSEQSEGIEQVNKAVTQMDEMTQQNAALVEQASAAGEAMADQARSMRQILGFFTTSASAGGGGSARLMAPAPAPEKPSSSHVSQTSTPTSTRVGETNSLDFADDDEEWEEF